MILRTWESCRKGPSGWCCRSVWRSTATGAVGRAQRCLYPTLTLAVPPVTFRDSPLTKTNQKQQGKGACICIYMGQPSRYNPDPEGARRICHLHGLNPLKQPVTMQPIRKDLENLELRQDPIGFHIAIYTCKTLKDILKCSSLCDPNEHLGRASPNVTH